jgi:hypothetical protein
MERSKITPRPTGVHRPAHDVEGVGPGILEGVLDNGRILPALSRLHDERRGPVAEERGRHDVRLVGPVRAERERAEFDGDEENDGPGLLPRQGAPRC